MKKLMYIVFFLFMAVNLFAQETYVIDSVCVGAQRTYARDGKDGYTYDWEIVDRQLADTIYPTGSDFVAVAGTDTTWGNEIEHLWDEQGEYDIIVYVTSEHGCDTLEQGQVKVFELPGVYAGRDTILCDQMAEMVLSGDTAWNYSALYWETLGDGTFSVDSSLHPVYYFGTNDITTGEITLVLKADGYAGNGTCEPAIDSVTFKFSSPEITLDWQDPICYNDSTGYIKATVDGGLPSFTYSWEGPPGFSAGDTDSIGGLWAGIYILTVTDANLCIDKDTVELINPLQLVDTIDSIHHVSCYGYADGFIYLHAEGGTGQLSFEWTDPDGYTANEDSIYNLSGGEYILRIFDEYGCELYDTVIVDEPDPLIAVIDSAVDVQCYGFDNGYAHVVVTDGTGPYTYSWSHDPALDSAWAYDLAPGWYTATITDLNGCMAWDSVYIDEPEPLLVTADSIDFRCDGDKPGEIHLEVTGGNQLANSPYYYFEWRNEADSLIATTKDITGLDGDQYYTVFVTDSLGCKDTLSVYVNEIPMMEMTVSIDTALCYGDLWNIDLEVSLGRPPYSYTWTDTSGVLIDTTQDMIGIPSGIYQVTITDKDSCELFREFELKEPPLLLATIEAEDSILCSFEELPIAGIITGGTGEVTFTWSGDGRSYLDRRDFRHVVFRAPPGTYTLIFSIVDEALCEASDTLEIIVYPPTYSNDSMEICAESDPFPWNNRMITSDMSRTYLDTLYGMNQYGCDSILTLDVTVLFPETYDTVIYICENEEPYAPYGNITILPDRDSIYLDTLSYVESGCDSLLITIEVFTKPVTYADLDTTLCAGADEFTWNHRWIQTDSSQVYLDTLENSFGCDSLLTYDVTIIPPDTFFVDTTFCQDEPEFVWNEITILTQHDSTYEAVLTNQFGCDSVVEMSVYILPVTDTLLDLEYCAGPGFTTLNNRQIIFDESRVYLDTLVGANQFGCDSLLTYDVTIIPPDTTNIDTTICEGEPIFAWGVNTIHQVDSYTDSIYTDILQNQSGCDSTVYLDVRILRPLDSMLTVDLCASDSFFWNNGTWIPGDRDSMYFDTLYYVQGCDSLRLQLEVISHPLYDTTMYMTLCEGSDSLEWEGHDVSTFIDSTYTTSWLTVWGCDSTLTLVVDIVPAFKDTIPETICFGEPLPDWYEHSISLEKDSIYIHNIPDVSGCDTLLYYVVTVFPVTDTIIPLTLCAGAPDTTLNNVTITSDQSRIYFDTIMNSYGCDSSLIYDVTILPPDTTLHYDTLCVGDPEYDWNGYTVSTTFEDVYVATVPTESGCDSVAILTTTLINGDLTYDTVYACVEYTWLDGTGDTYYVSDDYLYTLGSGTACPDTTWLHLVISNPAIVADPVDVLCYGDSTGSIEISVTGGVEPYNYLWSNGDTTQNISGLPAGSYTVTVTDALSDTLECMTTLEIEIKQPELITVNNIVITDVLVNGESTGSIEITVDGGTPDYDYLWINEAGIVVDSVEDLYNQPAGKYTLTVIDANDCEIQQTFEIIQPELTPCLEDTTLICFEDLVNYPLIETFQDYLTHMKPGQEIDPGCGIDTASFTSDFTVVSGSDFCYEEIRYYTLLDNCGGDTIFYCEQHVIVNDTEKPTISCPPTITVTDGIIPAAYADTARFLAAGGSFDDNCAVVSFRQVGPDVSDGGSDPEIITRTYEVADYCGNVQTCTQLIEVYMSFDFVIECNGLPPGSYECKADLPKYSTLQQFIDDGGYAYSNPFAIDSFWTTDVSNGRTCPETITRTYYIRNENGNIEWCSQTFVIDDQTPPEFELPDKNILCTDPMPRRYRDYDDVRRYGNGTITDNCTDMSGATVYLVEQSDPIGTCPALIERIYRVRDDCDNWKYTTEKIFIHDTIAPVIVSTPDDINTECYMPEPYADYNEFVDNGGWVTENCGTFDMVYMGDSVAGPSQPGLVYRTYRFVDECDNYSDFVQKITVLDKEPPLIGIPDSILDCDPVAVVTLEDFFDFGGWFSDNCEIDSSSFKLFDRDTIGDNCPRYYRNYFEIYDMSGNRGWTYHTITVVDSIPPVLTCPPGDTIDITEPFPSVIATLDSFYALGGTASDNCEVDPASFTIVSVDSVTIPCNESVTYTYQVADYCGNWSNLCSYTIYRFDVSDPVIDCMPDVFVECHGQPPVYNELDSFIAAGGYVWDNYALDSSSFVHLPDSFVGISCPLIIYRTYQISDICGNTSSCTFQITVHDTTPPVMTCPPDSSVICLSEVVNDITSITEFELAGGEIWDNCEIDPTSFEVYSETEYHGPGNTTVTFHYSIKDMCGNMDSCEQVITLTDTVPPDPECNDITVYLDDEGNYLFTDVDISNIAAGSSDNCTAEEDLIIDVDVVDFTCLDVEDGRIVNVVVTDEAGNWDDCMANIIVIDNIPPVALCRPATIYLDENGLAGITPDMIDNGSFDNCELDTIMLLKDQFDCTEIGDNTVGLVAVDAHGNSDTCYATVTVLDVINPEVTCIVRDTIQLSEEDGTYTLTWEMVTTSEWDNCEIVSRELDKYLLTCDDIGLTEIRATVIDQSGNEGSCTAEFIVIGNTPPDVQNDTAVTAVNIPVAVNVVNNDYDLKTSINISSLGVLINPSHGSVVVDNNTGIVTYTPDLDYEGTDVFRYSICDDGIPCVPMCGEALVFITVLPANQPPVAINDSFNLPCGNLTGNVKEDNGLGADYDPDGDRIYVVPIPVVHPRNGIVILYENGNFEYEPFVDFTEGIDSFRYEIRDDGIPNFYDSAWVYITRVADNDCDGIADVDDIDDDNDGIRDIYEGDMTIDSDNDGIPDSWDIDSDNDGILDNIEGQDEDNYIPPLGRDSDGDGWDDAYDPDSGGWPFDLDLTDTDGDTMPDFIDIDSDNDGVFDYIEGSDADSNGIADVIRIFIDTDLDGLDDSYDDVTGWAMPGNETGSNAPLQDFDGDGVRDWRDTNDEDDPYDTYVEDINGNGDYSDDDLDLDGRPEYLDTDMNCELFIPEGFSPNDDGVHDFFQILCIYPRYPEAKLMIFNRNGQKLFEKENYGNYDVWGWEDAWWWGTSENRLTLGRSGGLPAGNYVYVLELGNGEVRNGTVMIAY